MSNTWVDYGPVDFSVLQESAVSDQTYKEIMEHLEKGGAVMIRTALKNYGPYLKEHKGMFSRATGEHDRGVWVQHGKKKLYTAPEQIFFYKRK